ncbi:MAG: hypothetical protein WAS73_03300 [Defluviicoccus sp.]
MRRSCWLVLLAAAIVLGAAAAACSPARLQDAVRVLADIEAGHGPSGLKAATPAPQRTDITYAVADRTWQADLYQPGAPAQGGIVLVPGLTPKGRDDARLVAFATTLARARFTVLVPELERMRALTVTADDVRPIADAIVHLAATRRGKPVGIAAVSFGVGPAVLALQEPETEGLVRFAMTIGGYYDLADLVTFVTTGAYRDTTGTGWRRRQPKHYGKWIFVLSNAPRVADINDRVLLTEMARRRLDDATAPVDDLAAGLGAEGRTVYRLLTNTAPEQVPALLAELPPTMTSELDRLDLKRRDLSRLAVDFVIVHDRDDRIIPETHALALASALPPGRARVSLIDSLDHAQTGPTDLLDGLKLVEAVYTVLGMRD